MIQFNHRWLWALGVSIAALILRLIMKNPLKALKGKRIVVLGMRGAGKTAFYRYLQGKPANPQYTESGNDPYESFTYTKKSGEEIKICEGTDIGGGNDFKPYYKEMVEKSDSIIFIVDLAEYSKDEEVRREVRSRLEGILHFATEEKELLLLLSHSDQCGMKLESCKDAFKKDIENKGYSKWLNNYAAVNLLDHKQLGEIEKQIFK